MKTSICEFCKAEFQAKRKTARFCSDIHRASAFKGLVFKPEPPESTIPLPIPSITKKAREYPPYIAKVERNDGIESIPEWLWRVNEDLPYYHPRWGYSMDFDLLWKGLYQPYERSE